MRVLIVGALVSALVLVGCGKDTDSDSSEGSAAPTSRVSETAGPEASVGHADVSAANEQREAPVMPPEDTSADAVVEEARRSAQAATAVTGDTMDQVMATLDDYLQRNGAPAGGGIANRAGVSVEFATGMASAAVPPGSAAFSDARALAFERAFQNALSALAQNRSRSIATRVTSDVLQDTTNAATFVDACKPTADQALIQKAMQLVDAGLSQALRQLDVAEEHIASDSTPSFRCENPVVRDAISQSVRTSALASLRGARIVKSVATGGDVGVVVAVSPNFVASAEAMARGEASRNPNPDAAREIAASFDDLEPAEFLGEYGTRVVKLSNGESAVYAFGQAGANLTPNDIGAFRSTKRRAAQSAASRSAEAQLAQFAKVTTYFVNETESWAQLAQTMVVEDGIASQEQVQDVGRRMSEQIRSVAELRLEGAMVVRRWSVQDPDSGDQVEGVVLAWSPSLAGGIRQAQTPRTVGGAGATQSTGPARTIESREREEDW